MSVLIASTTGVSVVDVQVSSVRAYTVSAPGLVGTDHVVNIQYSPDSSEDFVDLVDYVTGEAVQLTAEKNVCVIEVDGRLRVSKPDTGSDSVAVYGTYPPAG